MTAEQFTYWLQGYLETSNSKEIGEKETQIIKDHLQLVFTKTTPIYDYNPIVIEPTIIPDWYYKTFIC